MEWFWIGLGMANTFIIGLLIGSFFFPSQRGQSQEQALELADMYDKLRHLYDRTRKRIDGQKLTPEIEGASPTDQELRQRAVERGLLRGAGVR